MKLALSLIVSGTLFMPSAAVGQSPEGPLVVVTGPRDADTTVLRLTEELAVMGFRVSSTTPEHDADARQFAEDQDAAALVRVLSSPGRVRVWLLPEEEPQVLSSAAGGEDQTLALRTAEFLRGRLLDVPPGTAPADTSEPADVETTSPPPPLVVHLGPTAVLSPGGIPAQLAIDLGVQWPVTGRVHLEGVGAIGLPGTTLTDKRSQEPVWTSWLGAGVGLEATPLEAPVVVGLAGGIGLLAVVFRDDNHQTSRWAALPYAHLSVRYRITNGFGVRFDATSAVALPAAELKLKGGETATFGQPMVTLGLGVEVAL